MNTVASQIVTRNLRVATGTEAGEESRIRRPDGEKDIVELRNNKVELAIGDDMIWRN